MSTQRPVPPRPLPRGSPSPGAGGPSQSPATRGRGGAPAIPERRRPDPPATPARTPPPIPPHHKAVPKPSKATEPAKQPLPQAPAAHATRPAPPKPTRSQAHVQAQPKPEEQQQPQQPKQPQQQQHHQQEHHHEEKHQQQQQEQQQQQQPQGEQPQAAENPAENKGGALPPKIPTGPKPMLRKKHSTVGKPPPPKPPAKKTAAAAVREAEEQPRQAAAPQATNPDGTPMTKRDQIAREILTTERTFVDLLQIALKEYYLPLLKSQPQIIPMDKLNTIFGNMRDVLHTNTILLNDLEDKMKDWGPQQKIGDAFAKLAPFLKIYTLYVSNFDNATATLDACEKIPAFAAFLEACHDKPDCRGQPLASLLILPVQRIPRYRLLLEDLVRHTDKTHPDYADLEKSLDTIKAVANQINEDVKRQENRQKIIDIQSKFTSLAGSLNLVEAHRLYIREGVLWKVCRRASKKRLFYLFNDLMLYASALPTGGLMVHRVIPLEELLLQDMPDSDEIKNAFTIGSSKKSFVVTAETNKEKFDWIVDITGAVNELKSKNESLGRTENTKEAHAPIWQPDSSAKNCTLCKAEFTITRRRHHCRSCGRLACANCSTHKLILPNIDKSQQRVCDKCYEEFKKFHEGATASGGDSGGGDSAASPSAYEEPPADNE